VSLQSHIAVIVGLFRGRNVNASSAALVRFVPLLRGLCCRGLAFDDGFALAQDVGPVLEYVEGNVLAPAVADQVVALLGEEEVCLARCGEI
jgi:hypothetical protein